MGTSLGLGQASDAIHQLMGGFPGVEVAHIAYQLKDLTHARPIASRVEQGAGGQAMGLQPSMGFALSDH